MPNSTLNDNELIVAMGIMTTATSIGPGGSQPHLWLIRPSIDLKPHDFPAVRIILIERAIGVPQSPRFVSSGDVGSVYPALRLGVYTIISK